MHVKLVSKTVGVSEDFENLDFDTILAYIARVSSNRTDKAEEAEKLIAFMLRHKHWSPFEMGGFCVEIKTSRAISLQIIRHRSFTFQQFSQRYAESTEFEPVNIRRQAIKNRQSSTEDFDPQITGIRLHPAPASELISDHLQDSENLYKALLAADVAKETARMILPETTSTTLYMNGTVRSWIHYIDARTYSGVQKEHREIALEIKKIFMKVLPKTALALGWE